MSITELFDKSICYRYLNSLNSGDNASKLLPFMIINVHLDLAWYNDSPYNQKLT